ncbi:MAG: glycosyltransferase [Methylocella sp.]
MELVYSIGWLAVVAWLTMRAFRQRDVFQQVAPAIAPLGPAAQRIAIVVPARDEACNIAACVATLIAQSYPASRLRVIVVDDHSRDETANIAAALARSERRLALLRSPSLPAGWIGKSHACWIGSRAVPAETDWLCFVDADIRAEPPLLATAVAVAQAGHLDFLSLTPRQELQSFAERLVMPCGLYLLAFSKDLRRIQAPDSGEASATGQFILVRRAAYEQVGGHAAVRTEICEDVALARLVKRSGFRVALAGAHQLLCTRMYTGWRMLWLGVSKNLVDMMGGPVATAVTATLGVALTWIAILLPLVDAIGCARGSDHACLAFAVALPATGAAFGLHVAGAVYFRIPFWYGLVFPLGYTAGALMALDSVRRRVMGGTSWKGRIYP